MTRAELEAVLPERSSFDAPPQMDAGEAHAWAQGWEAARDAVLALLAREGGEGEGKDG